MVLDLDKEDAETDAPVPKKRKQSAKSASKTKELAHSNQGSLVQKTISSLFKKAGEKVWCSSFVDIPGLYHGNY